MSFTRKECIILFINYTNLANANVVDVIIFVPMYICFIIALFLY